MKIKPLCDRVVIKMVEAEETTKSAEGFVMADHYRRSSATCTRRQRRGPSSKVRKWSIVGITAAYVLILAVGVRINGVVEAQAQYEAQVAATLEAEAASAQLAQEARGVVEGDHPYQLIVYHLDSGLSQHHLAAQGRPLAQLFVRQLGGQLLVHDGELCQVHRLHIAGKGPHHRGAYRWMRTLPSTLR